MIGADIAWQVTQQGWWGGMLVKQKVARTRSERSARDKSVALGLTQLLYLNLPIGLLGTVVIASILAYALVGHVPHGLVIAWMCTMVAVSSGRHWLCLNYRSSNVGPDEAQVWEDRFVLGALASGLTWGAASIFLFPLNSLPHQVFLGFILASMAAGAVSTLGTHLRVYVVYLLPGLLPYTVRLLSEGGELQIGMGVVFAFGQIILLVSARRFSAVTVTSLSLQFEKQQLVDALQSALAKAEDTNRAKTLFMANMSHEIRTPMNGVLGLTRLLMRTGLDERQGRLTNTIERSANSLLAIINDNLDFSRFEASNFTLATASFDLRCCLLDVISLSSVDADRKNVTIELTFDEGFPDWLVGDETRVRQICTNLVSNAVKFTQAGSVVVAATATDVTESRCQIRLVVRDTGIGISSEAQARIFQPFEQADTSITRRFGGTGLGLYISRQIARAMGGDIVLESAVDVGTCITATMNMERASPREIQEAEQCVRAAREWMRAPSAPTSLRAPPVQVLLADDNAVNIEVARGFLEAMPRSFAITEVRNGRAAIEAFTRQPFDIVLMDCRMPEMDGITAVQLIRTCEQRQLGAGRIPILAVTASTYDEDRQACIDAGFDDILRKPFTPDALQACLGQWLDWNESAPPPAQSPPRTAPTGASSSLDETVLDRFRQGTPDFFEHLIGIYIDELPHQMARMLKAAAETDVPTISSVAHSLKSSSASVGAIRLAELCGDIEHLCYNHTAQTVAPQVYDLVAKAAQEADIVATLLKASHAKSKSNGPRQPARQSVDEVAA